MQLSGFSSLRSNYNYTIGTASSINGCCRCIFQNTKTFDISRKMCIRDSPCSKFHTEEFKGPSALNSSLQTSCQSSWANMHSENDKPIIKFTIFFIFILICFSLVYPNLLNYLSLINKMIHIYISKNKTSIKNKGLEIVQLGRTLDHIH